MEQVVQRGERSNKVSLSISLSPKLEELRDDLAKVAVLSLEAGHVNEFCLIEVIPSLINKDLAGPITPINDDTYFLPTGCREDVNELCKLGSFTASTSDGPCKLKIAPWSVELGSMGRASGEGLWVHIWNLPLHAWCWSMITEVTRPVGELIALSQAKQPHKHFISVLVRQRAGVSLPMEIELSLGMRRYVVLLTGDRSGLLVFRRDFGQFVLTEKDGGEGSVRLDQQTKVQDPVVEHCSHAGVGRDGVAGVFCPEMRSTTVVEHCSHVDAERERDPGTSSPGIGPMVPPRIGFGPVEVECSVSQAS